MMMMAVVVIIITIIIIRGRCLTVQHDDGIYPTSRGPGQTSESARLLTAPTHLLFSNPNQN